MEDAEQKFVLKHVFMNVSGMEERVYNYSNVEEHFGVPWKIGVYRNKEHLGFHLKCLIRQEKKWSIETETEFKIVSLTGRIESKIEFDLYGNSENQSLNWGWPKFINWNRMMKEYVVDDELILEVSVKIEQMTGIEEENIRNLDTDVDELSDVVFVVERQKFYASKFYLATQSTYFKSLLLGRFKESRMSEIKLDGIESKDFQNFLEVLYLAPAIDDDTVDGIIKLADMYDSQVVVKKCEEFLVQESGKSTKEKLELAVKYNLDKLKNHCLSKINDINDVKSILPGDLTNLDPSIATEILQKCVGFKYAS